AVNTLLSDTSNHSSWNVPCQVGEFNDWGFLNAWQYAIQQYNTAGISWCVWTYKSTRYSNWSMYNPSNPPPTPDIPNDSSSTINSDWSQWTTSVFTVN